MLLNKSQQSIHAVDGIAPHLLFFVQVLAQFAVFFFQRHLRGDSGLKFGVETTGLRQKLGFLLQKGQYLRFKLL